MTAKKMWSGWTSVALVGAIAVAGALASGSGFAQGHGMGSGMMGGGHGSGMMGGDHGPGMMGGDHGPGMMGGDHGPGMMGGDHGPGMMGGGMGSGMMSGGMGSGMMSGGMGPGMMSGGMGPGMMGDYGHMPYGALNLSNEQRSKIARMQEDSISKNWDLMGQIRSEEFRLREMYRADRPDPTAVTEQQKKVDELRRQLSKAQLETRNQIDSLLTKEQRERLRAH